MSGELRATRAAASSTTRSAQCIPALAYAKLAPAACNMSTCMPTKRAFTYSKAVRPWSSISADILCCRERADSYRSGVPHAWIGSEQGKARWLDMLAPQPRTNGDAEHTYFLRSNPDHVRSSLDFRDPRIRHFSRITEDDIQVDKMKIGARINAPTTSAGLATPLLVFSGIAIKMLVDQRLDAALLTMFLVEYQPGGVIHPHDHPFEETYYILDGEVDAVADGKRYVLKPGDVFWTGVGSVHAFYNTSGKTVRWLETQAPQPPARHGIRFVHDWNYLKEKLTATETPVTIDNLQSNRRDNKYLPVVWVWAPARTIRFKA